VIKKISKPQKASYSREGLIYPLLGAEEHGGRTRSLVLRLYGLRIATAAEFLFKGEKVHGRIIECLIRGRTAAAAVCFPSAIRAWQVMTGST
jgi:hypothetical protein